jgi:hypothetical protein
VKQCAKCGETKPHDAFGRKKKAKDGLNWRCRECCRESGRADSSRERDRARRLALYGLSEAGYAALMESQGGVCAICEGVCETGRNLAVDHNHACCATDMRLARETCGNCVRGLLCRRCNQLLGQVRDSVEILSAAVSYLERAAA